MTITATASANTNIALIKYWGKADESLAIPATSSLSLTLGGTRTTTTVSFDGGTGGEDAVTINGATPGGTARERGVRFLDLVRARAGMAIPASVTSSSTVPLAAGLASSAAGFAALAAAATRAAGMRLDERALSRLARRGSGSATRSIFGGLAPAMVVVVVSAGRKTISSTQAMRHTMNTSPLYPAWAEASREDLRVALDAVRARDLPRLGEVVEGNALGMHAAMIASRPSVVYWLPETLDVLHTVRVMRDEGFPVWATIDAGPNVKVLTTGEDADQVAAVLRDRIPCATTSVRYPGGGVRVEEVTA